MKIKQFSMIFIFIVNINDALNINSAITAAATVTATVTTS